MKQNEQRVKSLEDRIPYMKEQRRKRANRRLAFILTTFALLVAFVVYMQTSLSDLKDVRIAGNIWLSEQQLLEASGLEADTKFIQLSTRKTSEAIQQIAGIKKVEVQRKWYNRLTITVVEEKMIAYAKEKDVEYVVLADGSFHAVKELPTGQGKEGPLLKNFQDEADLLNVAEELERVSNGIRSRMSEVERTESKEGPSRFKIYMNDGNTLLTPTLNLAETLDKYEEIYENIPKGQTGTVVMDGGYYFTPYKQAETKE